MARIKIHDLAKDVNLSKEEIKKVFGGAGKSLTQRPSFQSLTDVAAPFIPGGIQDNIEYSTTDLNIRTNLIEW